VRGTVLHLTIGHSLLRAALLLALVAVGVAAAQEAALPNAGLPDAPSFLAAARENLAKASRIQGRYAYKERATELHRNPFGRIGSGGVRVFEMRPTGEPGVFMRRLLEDDGVAVPDADPERVERRSRRPQRRSSIDDAAAVLKFTVVRRERVNGRDQIVVRFEGDPEAEPETREGRIAKMLAGHIWIDEQAREVVRAEATATDDVSYGLGMVVRLRKGARVSMTRALVDSTPEGQVRMLTSLRFTGEGRAMLFRKLTVNHVIEWFDYEVAR
jgi:hypothetical protein